MHIPSFTGVALWPVGMLYEGARRLPLTFSSELARHQLRERFPLVISCYIVCDCIFNFSLVLCLIWNGPVVIFVGVVKFFVSSSVGN